MYPSSSMSIAAAAIRLKINPVFIPKCQKVISELSIKGQVRVSFLVLIGQNNLLLTFGFKGDMISTPHCR